MKSLIAATTALMLLLSAAPAAFGAQTRTRRSTTPQRRRAPAKPATSSLDATRTNAVRLQLASLNKDMTRFLYVYGRLSKDLELTGSQTESADVTNKTRAGLIESLKTMSNRLDQLEGQVRFTPGLERHYRSLQGVSARAAQAEANAAAGRFDAAGRILVEVAATLTDVLLEM
ncbi:MAG TPA: hypothetical protein VF064_05380 [Pyrinomonadaceae bacterium]